MCNDWSVVAPRERGRPDRVTDRSLGIYSSENFLLAGVHGFLAKLQIHSETGPRHTQEGRNTVRRFLKASHHCTLRVFTSLSPKLPFRSDPFSRFAPF
jgi:hypothetical protein